MGDQGGKKARRNRILQTFGVLRPEFGEEMLKYLNLLPMLFPGLSQSLDNHAERAELR